jgi:hypothetical protein
VQSSPVPPPPVAPVIPTPPPPVYSKHPKVVFVHPVYYKHGKWGR